MVYDISKIIPTTKAEVLDMVDELSIYAKYLGFKPKLNQIYTSPLRDDKSPSFSLFLGNNGHILHKDFGTGRSGDCIEFIRKLKNITTRDAINEVLQTLKDSNFIPLSPVKRLRQIPSSATKIEIRKMPFTKEGLAYWAQYGINENILAKYDVFQTSKVWIRDKLKFFHKAGNLIFTYQIYDRLKVYMPMHESVRFLTNCNTYYIQGWKQLNFKNDILIITKSLKDVMVLDKLGYSAIAPNAESYNIPENIVNEIRRRFKTIILFYDRDMAGMTNTHKLVRKYGFNYFFIPKKYKIKDISDFYKAKGKKETIKLLSNLIQKVCQQLKH